MQCFARWEKDDHLNVFFRDQTILQFGDSWELRANFILLNPGSALPLDKSDQTELLRSKCLPFFMEPNIGEKYVKFGIDPLMRNILKLFLSEYSGGTIRLYNLFNLKDQDSSKAVKQFSANMTHQKMFASDAEINFCGAPVIIASGTKAKKNADLRNELIRYIKLAKNERLYKIAKLGKNEFSIIKTEPDSTGFIESYHPSYTFMYGNYTDIGDLVPSRNN